MLVKDTQFVFIYNHPFHIPVAFTDVRLFVLQTILNPFVALEISILGFQKSAGMVSYSLHNCWNSPGRNL